MKRGVIDEAPIYSDVRTISGNAIPDRIDLVYAGFPCQDISSANVSGLGLRGDRSGLFWHVVRLVNERCDIRGIMLENVTQFAVKGFREACESLEAAGFNLKHVVMSARQMGAPHLRKRIFIWGERSSTQWPAVQRQLSTDMWLKEPPRHIVLSPDCRRSARIRMSIFGNSIVPHCIQHAYLYLVWQVRPLDNPVDLSIMLSDGNRNISRTFWATPSATPRHYYAYRLLTRRGSTLLFNQLMHDQSRQHVENEYPNPAYVEWMMGFPENYIREDLQK